MSLSVQPPVTHDLRHALRKNNHVLRVIGFLPKEERDSLTHVDRFFNGFFRLFRGLEVSQSSIRNPSLCSSALKGLHGAAVTLGKIGEFSGVLVAQNQSLRIMKCIKLDTRSDEFASFLRGKGFSHRSLGQFHEALTCFRQALSIKQGVHKRKDYEDVAVAHRDISDLLKRQGQFKQALGAGQQALNIRQRLYPKGHILVAESLENVAFLMTRLSDYDAALNHYRQALKILKNEHDGDHFETAVCLSNVAFVCQKLGDFELALESSRESHDMRKRLEQPPLSIAKSSNKVGLLLSSLGRLGEALSYFKEATILSLVAVGSSSEDVDVYVRNVISALGRIANGPLKRQTVQEVLSTCIERLGQSHELTQLLRAESGSNSFCLMM